MPIKFYQETPKASISHIVKRFFVIDYPDQVIRKDFLLPDGTPSFFYMDTDENFQIKFYQSDEIQELRRGVYVAFGNTYSEYEHSKARIVGLSFYPVYMSLLFSASPDKFMNKFVRLEDLTQANVMDWPPSMASFTDQEIMSNLEKFIELREAQVSFSVKFKELYEHLITPEGHLMTVKDMAEWLGFSTRHTNELFKKLLGMSPKKFLELARFNHALKVMDDLGEHGNLSQVAHEVGYHDQAHFIHDFKKICGKTPSELRPDPESIAHKFRFFEG